MFKKKMIEDMELDELVIEGDKRIGRTERQHENHDWNLSILQEVEYGELVSIDGVA